MKNPINDEETLPMPNPEHSPMLEALRDIERNATWNDDDSVEDLRRRLDNLSHDAMEAIAKAKR